jgi:hypothetical protein
VFLFYVIFFYLKLLRMRQQAGEIWTESKTCTEELIKLVENRKE